MNFKLHLLDAYLDYFPENLGDRSEEQGGRFHQDIKEMECRYQGRWDINMMTSYSWTIKRGMPSNKQERTRAPIKRSF